MVQGVPALPTALAAAHCGGGGTGEEWRRRGERVHAVAQCGGGGTRSRASVAAACEESTASKGARLVGASTPSTSHTACARSCSRLSPAGAVASRRSSEPLRSTYHASSWAAALLWAEDVALVDAAPAAPEPAPEPSSEGASATACMRSPRRLHSSQVPPSSEGASAVTSSPLLVSCSLVHSVRTSVTRYARSARLIASARSPRGVATRSRSRQPACAASRRDAAVAKSIERIRALSSAAPVGRRWAPW